MTEIMNATVATATEDTKTRKPRTVAPKLSLSEALEQFDAKKIKGFFAEYGEHKNSALIIRINGVPQILTPDNDGYAIADYDKMRNFLVMADSMVASIKVKAL